MERPLNEYDVLIRYNEAVEIVKRVMSHAEAEEFPPLSERVSPIQPFSLRTNFRGKSDSSGMKEPIRLFQSGGAAFIDRAEVPRNDEWLDEWKVFLSSTASEHGGQADKNGMRRVFSRIMVGGPGTACTETYLVAGRFATQHEAENFSTYLRTRFVRFLVSLRTNTQHLYNERFAFVPDLPMDRIWTDDDLYREFNISESSQLFIESMIRPIEEPNA